MKPVLIPRHQHLFFRFFLALTLLAVLYLSVIPIHQELPGGFSDKFYHGLCFLILGFLADFAWPDTPFGPLKITLVFAYGILIEVIQFFIPHRSFSIADMLADALGLAVYALSIRALSLLFRQRNENLPPFQ